MKPEKRPHTRSARKASWGGYVWRSDFGKTPVVTKQVGERVIRRPAQVHRVSLHNADFSQSQAPHTIPPYPSIPPTPFVTLL